MRTKRVRSQHAPETKHTHPRLHFVARLSLCLGLDSCGEQNAMIRWLGAGSENMYMYFGRSTNKQLLMMQMLLMLC